MTRYWSDYTQAESVSASDAPYAVKLAAWEVIRTVGCEPSGVYYKPGMSLFLEWGKRCELVITESTFMLQIKNRSGSTTQVIAMDRKTMGKAHIQTAAEIISRCRKLKSDPEADYNSEDR